MSPRRGNPKGLWAASILVLAVAGCASIGETSRTRPSDPADHPAVHDAPNARQYYDQRAGRYYYFDPKRARYYWEDGTPKY